MVLHEVAQNNLRDVSVTLPKHALTVVTGPSGSGKSSLVFGTLAAEAQRQLYETFPAFVRHRLPGRERPRARRLENLTMTVVIDQRRPAGNTRSTVGTTSEAHTALRVLFSRCATPSAGPAQVYSFNDPLGMCVRCHGLGTARELDLDRLLRGDRSLNEGAIDFPAFSPGSATWQLYAESGLFDADKPLGAFTGQERELLLYGHGFHVKRRTGAGVYRNAYEGVVPRLERRFLRRETDALSERERVALARVTRVQTCPVCRGARLNAAALASRLAGHTIAECADMPVDQLVPLLTRARAADAGPLADEALTVLRRIQVVGLGYLSLARATTTLSGGELQRLKCVRHLGSSLTDVTYLFDEPTAGLHPADVEALAEVLLALRDNGNTVIAVTHDPAVMDLADHVIDLGPGAGAHGGQIVFTGTPAQLRAARTTTGAALRAARVHKECPRTPHRFLDVSGAGRANLREEHVELPEGVMCVVTGVAGAGKSSLLTALVEQHPAAVLIDQAEIGASPRATAATYSGAMDALRKLFSKASGAGAGLFSSNSSGACPQCRGRGEVETDLAYLEPVSRTCEVCGGSRYRPEALKHRLHGRTVAEVLGMTVGQALETFTSPPALAGALRPLGEVGLSYLTLGRTLSTLSGGERQRLKLAAHLKESGRLFVFDDPTSGLHLADTAVLLRLLDRLVDAGNSLVVATHDLEVVRHADWVVDLGPGPGDRGGRVVHSGTLAALLDRTSSLTADHLRSYLAAPDAAQGAAAESASEGSVAAQRRLQGP
ncbi:ATP-binding cassette domain-containing protein [Streptomyces sp. DW4-2]|uniref:UvrABC system protein A n=1 Tax=Streptomyces spirodelae TaxID=2812904 RepID=A0ABS3X0F6_9ACTN|nr:ATP-binding cassette domain-containing protein [Streptomyces spirodelae]